MISAENVWNMFGDFGGARPPRRAKKVAIIGAPKTGKSILAISLIHSERRRFHSFNRVLAFNFPSLPIDLEATLRQEILAGIRDGLTSAGTAVESGGEPDDGPTNRSALRPPPPGPRMSGEIAAIPEIPLNFFFEFKPQQRGRRYGAQLPTTQTFEQSVLIRDCPGAMLIADDMTDRVTAKRRRDAIRDISKESDAIILCLPLSGPEPDIHRGAVLRYIGDLTESFAGRGGAGKRLVIALTKFEAAVADSFARHRNALASTMTPLSYAGYRDHGLKLILDALDERGGDSGALLAALRILASATGIEIWMTPVSAYGFVKNSGAPNVYRSDDGGGDGTDMLLMSPAAQSRFMKDIGLEAQVDEIDAEDCLAAWSPYRVADPIILAALDQKRLDPLMAETLDDTLIVRSSDFMDAPA